MNGGKCARVGLASLALLAWWVGEMAAQTSPAGTNRVVASVNGESITMTDLEAVLSQAGPVPFQLSEDQRKQRQMAALGFLIDEKLMVQFLNQQQVSPIAAVELNKKIGELKIELARQKKTLEEYCREKNWTETQLRERFAQEIRLFNYLRTRITDAEIAQYYEKYRDYFDGVQVRASHIVLRIPPTATESERAQAQAKLKELRAKIEANQISFEQAARENSQCPSAASGGDIGYFPRKYMFEEEIAEAAFALKTVGQISDVVQSGYGLHLIKLTDRKAGQPSDFTKIKEGVRESCSMDKTLQILAEQRRTAKIDIYLPH